MNQQKHRFTLMVPLDLWNRIKALVKRTRRAATQEIILAIEEHLDKEADSTTPEKGRKP
jgi:hypothetical protein